MEKAERDSQRGLTQQASLQMSFIHGHRFFHRYSNVIVKYLCLIQVLKSSDVVGVFFSRFFFFTLGAAGYFQSEGY